MSNTNEMWQEVVELIQSLPVKKQAQLVRSIGDFIKKAMPKTTVKTVGDLEVNNLAGVFNPSVKATQQVQKSLKEHGGDVRKTLQSLDGQTLAKLPWETLEILKKRMEKQEHEAIKNQVKKRGSLFEQVVREELKKLNQPPTTAHRRSEKAFGRGLPIGTKQKKVPIFGFGLNGVKKLGEREVEDEA